MAVQLRNRLSILAPAEYFLLLLSFRLALECTRLPIQWVTCALFLQQSGIAANLTSNLYLVPRLRMRGGIPLFSHTYSLHGA
jgi:hypothetical protein